MVTQFGLARASRFAPLWLSHCLGSLNAGILLGAVAASLGRPNGGFWSVVPASATIGSGMLVLLFLLTAAIAGQFADRFDRGRLFRGARLLEFGVAALAATGFATDNGQMVFAAIPFLGVTCGLSAPLTYASLPELVQRDELIGGNALIAGTGFISFFLGFLAVGWIFVTNRELVSIAPITLAIASYACSRTLPPTAAHEPRLPVTRNPLAAWRDSLEIIRGNRTVLLSSLGVSWFWFFCAALITLGFALENTPVGGVPQATSQWIGLFAAGMLIGALSCAPLSDGRVEIGLVPIGSLGLTLFTLDLAYATHVSGGAAPGLVALSGQPHSWRMAFDLLILGFFGGLYLVPLLALIQTRSDATHRARVIAGGSLVSILFFVAAIIASTALTWLGLTLAQSLLAIAILNAAVAVYSYRVVPEFLMRLVVWGLVHTFYRLRKSGLEHVPDEGPAIVVCNHVSFVDAVVISAACRRPIRFVMDHRIFALPVWNFVFRVTRAIPIASPKDDIELLRRAYAEIARALDAGDIVGIFPEGRITDTGEIAPFQNGIKRIIDRNPVTVVPMALRGLWGSFFSRKDAPAMTRPLRRGLFSRIELVVAPGVPPEQATPKLLQQIVSDLRGQWK